MKIQLRINGRIIAKNIKISNKHIKPNEIITIILFYNLIQLLILIIL